MAPLILSLGTVPEHARRNTLRVVAPECYPTARKKAKKNDDREASVREKPPLPAETPANEQDAKNERQERHARWLNAEGYDFRRDEKYRFHSPLALHSNQKKLDEGILHQNRVVPLWAGRQKRDRAID